MVSTASRFERARELINSLCMKVKRHYPVAYRATSFLSMRTALFWHCVLRTVQQPFFIKISVLKKLI